MIYSQEGSVEAEVCPPAPLRQGPENRSGTGKEICKMVKILFVCHGKI